MNGERPAHERAEELRHAKRVSDEILELIGISPHNRYTAPVKFPGLEEAERAEEAEYQERMARYREES